MSLANKIRNRLLYLQWQFLRRKYRPNDKPPWFESINSWVNPAPFFSQLLTATTRQTFLEIGIGLKPNIDRLRVMADAGVSYTACDFQHVCDAHQKIVDSTPELRNLKYRFLGNPRRGTYAWTLFRLLAQSEKFDLVYLDGHHTFYIDCPAFVLAHLLLKPGGVFLLDDVTWNLTFHQRVMMWSFTEWMFFRNVYDFAQYDQEQQEMPHMKMLADTVLLDNFKYSKLEEYSTPEWWALRKPYELSWRAEELAATALLP